MNKTFVFDTLTLSFCTLFLFSQADAAMNDNSHGKGSLKEYWTTKNKQLLPKEPIKERQLSFEQTLTSDEQCIVGIQFCIDQDPSIRNQIAFINLAGQFNLTDKTLRFIAENFPLIKSIILSGCTAMTDDGIINIVCNCFNLEKMSLRNTRLTDLGLKEIGENCVNLKELCLDGFRCTNKSEPYATISDQQIRVLQSKLPLCKIIRS